MPILESSKGGNRMNRKNWWIGVLGGLGMLIVAFVAAWTFGEYFEDYAQLIINNGGLKAIIEGK